MLQGTSKHFKHVMSPAKTLGDWGTSCFSLALQATDCRLLGENTWLGRDGEVLLPTE